MNIVVYKRGLTSHIMIEETGVGWDKFWLGQCLSVPNELPDGDTYDVFRQHVTSSITGDAHIIDARCVSKISPKRTFLQRK